MEGSTNDLCVRVQAYHALSLINHINYSIFFLHLHDGQKFGDVGRKQKGEKYEIFHYGHPVTPNEKIKDEIFKCFFLVKSIFKCVKN